jgi:hypothetical protein
MIGAIPPLPNTPSWRGAELSTGNIKGSGHRNTWLYKNCILGIDGGCVRKNAEVFGPKKEAFGRPRCRLKNNIKVAFREMREGSGFIWFRLGPALGFCKHCSEPSGSIKQGVYWAY